ncbi:MAG TPA: T9SS type A sorting domain-containing protein [Bacteroidia bacterium]|nr:T9SS type A sorting domain-containing protein [Bacteroidia bacterium]
MKRKLFFSVLIFFLSVAAVVNSNGQNYIVGVPVNDSLQYFGYGANQTCYPDPEKCAMFPLSMVTGVNHVFIVAGVSQDSVILQVNTDTIHTGDTISPPYFCLYFPYNSGGMVGSFKAIGTPQVAGEVYNCNWGLWLSDLGICPENLGALASAQCTVQVSTLSNEITADINNIVLFPNPASSQLNFSFTEAGNYFLTIKNTLGETIFVKSVTEKEISVDVKDFPAGIYFVTVTDKKENRVTRKFVKM